MKKIIKKISLTFFTLYSMLCTTVYGNMTAEAMDESIKFYDEHKFIIESTNTITELMIISFLIFIIVIPIIIIFKLVKYNKNKDEKYEYSIKTLGIAEIVFIINVFYSTRVYSLLSYGSENNLYKNISIIISSLVSIGIVIFFAYLFHNRLKNKIKD